MIQLPSGAARIQGLPEGYGDPVLVTIIGGGGPSGGLTNVELRATPVPISGTVDVNFPSSMEVTGDFYPATQPVSIAATVAVSGPLTDAQLRAASIPISGTVTANLGTIAGVATETSLTALNTKTPALGQATMAASTPVVIASNQPAIPVSGSFSAGSVEALATGRGKVCTFRTPGRAGTSGARLFALHNAAGSTKIVHINHLFVDLTCTVVKAVTVLPPLIKVHRFTAIPTNGTALTKVTKDTTLSSNASITAWGDASADGTLSGTALAVTIPAGNVLTEEFAPRLITAAGYEMYDRTMLLEGSDIVLRALEGIVIELSYTLATQNPATDMWIAGCDWYEL